MGLCPLWEGNSLMEDKGHARHARCAHRRRLFADATSLLPLAPQQATHPAALAQTRPRPSERWGRRQGAAPRTRLAGRLRLALRRGVPPRAAPRRHPLPRRAPGLRQRRPRLGPPPHPRPGAAPAGSVLLHRRAAPAVPGREGFARQIQGHRQPARHGHVANSPCPVHRAERGDVQSWGAQQRGGVRAVRRRGVRVALPRGLLAGLRHRVPRRRRLSSRRGPAHQIVRVLELSPCRRLTVWHGVDELDHDMLLRVHAIPHESRKIAQVAAEG